MRAHFIKLCLEKGDPAADGPAVDLELRLAGTAHADAAGGTARSPTRLACQVRPGAGQARQAVHELRQLDLERTLARARVPSKDIEDERRAVQYLDLCILAERALDLALLARRQLVVKDDHVIV